MTSCLAPYCSSLSSPVLQWSHISHMGIQRNAGPSCQHQPVCIRFHGSFSFAVPFKRVWLANHRRQRLWLADLAVGSGGRQQWKTSLCPSSSPPSTPLSSGRWSCKESWLLCPYKVRERFSVWLSWSSSDASKSNSTSVKEKVKNIKTSGRIEFNRYFFF